MIDRANTWIIKKYIMGCNRLDEFEKEKVEYAMDILLNEAEKIMGILFFFMTMGRVKMFIMSLAVLMSVRVFVGGLHFSKRYQCFIFTLVFFILTVYLSELFIISKAKGAMFFVQAFINIVLCAPIPSKHRIMVSDTRKKKLRNQALSVMTMWFICYVLSEDSSANIILWTVIAQQTEILYYILIHRRK